jgi:hypothetical protein
LSDDAGEAVEVPPGSGVFQGSYFYGSNTDGITVSGITGTGWTIIIDAVDFGDVTTWAAASGDNADLSLTLGNEYRITPFGNRPSGAPVGGGPAPSVPEPTTILLLGLGLAGLGYARKWLH